MAGKWLAAVALSGLVLAAGMQYRYDSSIHYFGERNTFVSLPSGKSLKILSFGYTNLASDLLFIWSIQFYSSYYLTNRYHFLERVFDTITDITPSYKEPYIIGAMIMALEARDIPMALRLLEKGSRKNPTEWAFDLDAGFYSYKYLKDYVKAEKYYNQAAAKPDAPIFIKRMNAHMVYLRNDLKMATRMWLDIYKNASDILTKDSAFNHLYQLKAESDIPVLQEKITAFRQKFNRWPSSLAELVRTGLVSGMPRDFAGNEYQYDPSQGTVKAERIFRWKRH
jgi:tetratricopeptide (TPR) repeat protein